MVKCTGLDRNGYQCNFSSLNDIDYCKFHEYLLNYTTKQLDNLKLCKGCLKWKFLDENIKICLECKIRGDDNRIKHKNNKVFCKKEGCKFEKSDDNE